jgi:hypothetical protein
MFFVVGSRLPLVAGCPFAFFIKELIFSICKCCLGIRQNKTWGEAGGGDAKGEGRTRDGFSSFLVIQKLSPDPAPSRTVPAKLADKAGAGMTCLVPYTNKMQEVLAISFYMK